MVEVCETSGVWRSRLVKGRRLVTLFTVSVNAGCAFRTRTNRQVSRDPTAGEGDLP
jgi:hypothetical protein